MNSYCELFAEVGLLLLFNTLINDLCTRNNSQSFYPSYVFIELIWRQGVALNTFLCAVENKVQSQSCFYKCRAWTISCNNKPLKMF